MRCTEVADRPLPDGEFTCRDIGDRERYRIGVADMNFKSLLLPILTAFASQHALAEGTRISPKWIKENQAG